MKYAYVCTNYNNSRFTVMAVDTINACALPPAHIVVVDNASGEADVAVLRQLAARHPNVVLVLSAENTGYFPGLNLGIHRSREIDSDVDCMIIGNNDLEFARDFGDTLKTFVPPLRDEAVICPGIVTIDNVRQNPYVVEGVSRQRELLYDLYYSNYQIARFLIVAANLTAKHTARRDCEHFAERRHIAWGLGACYILTRKFFEHFTELWAPTFLIGEEWYLHRQLANAGFRMFYEPGIEVRHHNNGAIRDVPVRKLWDLGRESHLLRRQHVKGWLPLRPQSQPS